MVTARRAWFPACSLVACLGLAAIVSTCPAKPLRGPQPEEPAAAAIVFQMFLEGLGPQPASRLVSPGTLAEFDNDCDGRLTRTESIRASAALKQQLEGIGRIRSMFDLMIGSD